MRGAFTRVVSHLASAAGASTAGAGPASLAAGIERAAGAAAPPRALRAAFASYASPGASPSATAPRRVPQKPRGGENGGGGGASGAHGAAGASAGGPMMAEMSREVPGGSKPMQSWERWYWGIGVGGVSAWLFWRLKPDGKTAEEIEEERRKAAELEVKRKDHLRAVLAAQRGGGFIAAGEDPLDGLSPKRIEELMAEAGIDPRDPLEGMSPEEIDEYMRRQEEAAAGAAGSG